MLPALTPCVSGEPGSAHASFIPRESFQTFAALVSAGALIPPLPFLLVASLIALFPTALSI